MSGWSRRRGARARSVVLLSLVVLLGCPKRPPSGREPQRASKEVQPEQPSAPESTPSPDPAPNPPAGSPRLLPDPADAPREDTERTLAKAENGLRVLAERALDDRQRAERDAGAAFVTQARGALQTGDPDRAAVLAEKALALIENLEQATRP